MKNIYLKKPSLLLALVGALLLPAPARAIDVGVCIGDKCRFAGYEQYVVTLFQYAMKAGVVLTVLMVIYAGYKYMTSQGNPSAINEAKEILIGTLSGFAMLVLVYFILTFLNLPKISLSP